MFYIAVDCQMSNKACFSDYLDTDIYNERKAASECGVAAAPPGAWDLQQGRRHRETGS